MTDTVKLIVEIPKNVYAECLGDIYFPDTGGELFNAVKNGTPLVEEIDRMKITENKGECKECKWYDEERIYNVECENCSRSFNDNFRRSDMRGE